MRNKLISSLAGGAAFSFTASGFAFAADMPVKAPPPPPAPVYNWTGWYAGFNFGGGFGTSNNATTTSTPLADDLAQFFPRTSPSGSTAGANSGVAGLNQSGPIGGVQIGYNFQLNPLFVFGFEADIQGAAITSDRAGNTGTSTESFAGTSAFVKTASVPNSAEALVASFTNAAITANGFDSVTADVNWLGTVRLRAGYLITPSLLIYATGGLAYGGVSASDSATTNFNLSADSFVLAYGQAIGPTPSLALAVTSGAAQSASVTATTGTVSNTTTYTSAMTSASLSPNSASLTAIIQCIGTCGSANQNAGATTGPPTSVAFATNSIAAPQAQSTISYSQATKPLSVALATTAQSFAHVSDTKYGGTVGGGLEWMMAPNWSVKAEALYYDLGSVTVTPAPLTASINPITAPIPTTVNGNSTATVTSAINKFVGPGATVSNATSTHVSFQGVIIRLGLNYHFNLL
jgi:opacity protein-like surface antigen